jgi:hypothetical protein
MKTFNHEINLKITSKDPNTNILFNRSDKFIDEIVNAINKKHPNHFKFETREKVGIEFFSKKMERNENFSFIKYGDGELLCMIGGMGKNCDDHPYSKTLGKLLEQSFVKLFRFYDDVYLAEWTDNLVDTRNSYIRKNNLKPKFAEYECFLTLEENIKNNKLLNFYKLLKNSKRKKIFIGPKKLVKVKNMLDIDKYIDVPIVNAFSEYDKVKSQLYDYGVNDNNIYILCCSMMSCVICSDLKEMNPKITLLDVGSGFDPIFSQKTRPKQPTTSNCFNYFREVLPKGYVFDKTRAAVNSLNKMCGSF